MKKLIYSIVAFATMSVIMPAWAVTDPIPLQEGYIDPGSGTGQHKGPVKVPEISLDDHTLYFYTPCDGFTLNLVDENDVVVYTVVIPTGTTSWVLPATLSGEYELQLITGNYCFWGMITL